jgi:large subunit ribosomal protein L24
MKSDTERKKYYAEKLHRKKSRLHVHLSKDLRSKLKVKKRSALVRKGDTVRVMRGPGKGKEAKVGDVNTVRRKVFLEGVMAKNARGREVVIALEPSNLLLLALEPTKERKEIFSEDAFRKRESQKKEAPKSEAAKAEAAKPEQKAEASAKPAEQKAVHSHEHKEHGHEHKPGQTEHKPAHAAAEHKRPEHRTPEHKTPEHGTHEHKAPTPANPVQPPQKSAAPKPDTQK